MQYLARVEGGRIVAAVEIDEVGHDWTAVREWHAALGRWGLTQDTATPATDVTARYLDEGWERVGKADLASQPPPLKYSLPPRGDD